MPKKKNAPLTLDERVMMAQTGAAAALSMFELAATDLNTAADALEEIAAEAQAEADKMTGVRDAALADATDRRVQAMAIQNIYKVGQQ